MQYYTYHKLLLEHLAKWNQSVSVCKTQVPYLLGAGEYLKHLAVMLRVPQN